MKVYALFEWGGYHDYLFPGWLRAFTETILVFWEINRCVSSLSLTGSTAVIFSVSGNQHYPDKFLRLEAGT